MFCSIGTVIMFIVILYPSFFVFAYFSWIRKVMFNCKHHTVTSTSSCSVTGHREPVGTSLSCASGNTTTIVSFIVWCLDFAFKRATPQAPAPGASLRGAGSLSKTSSTRGCCTTHVASCPWQIQVLTPTKVSFSLPSIKRRIWTIDTPSLVK